MKKNNYYIYMNIDELYGFLVYNMVFPASRETTSVSLSKRGFIYLTKKRFSREFIYSRCQAGVMSPVVLEISIKTNRDKSVIVVSDDELLVSNPISLNSLVGVYYLDGELPLSLFDDTYLFRSLLNNKVFEYGGDLPTNLDDYCGNALNDENIKLWNKIQGLYACRYGALRSEFKMGKKLMIASNLDNDSALEILGQSQRDYFVSSFAPYKKYFFKDDTNVSSPISLFFNNNYELLLANKKIKDKSEEKVLAERLLEGCYRYSKDCDLLDLIRSPLVNEVRNIESNTQGDIFELKAALFKQGNENARFLYLLNAIAVKDYENALAYLSNFDALSEIEKKCLLSLYGLCVGMSRLSISIKRKRPDLLLLSFNRTKKYFKEFIDVGVNNNDFFSLREIVTDYVTNEGFNYNAYNRDYELNYLKIMCANKLLSLNVPKGMIGKDIIKFTTSEELHKTYLLAKRGMKYEIF